MQKEFKTIDQQIAILKGRQLVIDDEERAKKYLLSNNYYNIINGYSRPFLEDRNLYKVGTNFDEISHLYFFDKECKQTLFNAILDAEHHLKSSFAYHFAEAHQDNPEAYLDVTSYNHRCSPDIAYIITKLNRIIKTNKYYPNNSIYHYCQNYDNLPIWVLVDYLDFGDLYTLIKVSPTKIQNEIARDMADFIRKNNPSFHDNFQPAIMLSFIKNIHEVRNICAHNKRLIYFECRSDSIYFPFIHDQYHINAEDHRKNIYTTFISLQCFISNTEYAKLNNTLRKRMKKILFNHIYTIDPNDILAKLGFPMNWQELPSLSQE